MACFRCPITKEKHCGPGCGACDECPGDNPDKEDVRNFNGMTEADY